MKKTEIQHKLEAIITNFDKDNFIYEFLLAFGISKTTITRLKKGDANLSKKEGELILKNKLFFTIEETQNLFNRIDELVKDDATQRHKPRFIIVTDFETIVATDTKLKTNKDFTISELSNQVDFFLPLSGAEIYRVSSDNKADRDAAYKLGELYDILVNDNPDWVNQGSHQLNLFLSRLLFCFFAEDTGIFERKSIFTETLVNNTKEDGSDVDEFLNVLFRKLNSEEKKFPAYLDGFPYVNGGLFKDTITSPKFSKKARQILVASGELEWAEINPDIFGSMIQAVADPEERTNLGMHYTSVVNILKLIKPLFLDELEEEFEKNVDNSNGLKKLISRISKIKFFDPACGSGNFLIITYKEIRALEIKIIKRVIDLIPEGQTIPLQFTSIKLSQFYGIEIKDFAHEMAILSLWLAEHQMNQVFETELPDFGRVEPILPLKQAGNITSGNAARIDWETVCPKKKDDEIYIIGNPPYLGSRNQDAAQKSDMAWTFNNVKDYKKLDYVACWFYTASLYIQHIKAKYAFVTTNSIAQGEQVSLLWPLILDKKQEIYFAHQSFKWENNAKGNAGVAVVIIGIRNTEETDKYLYNQNFKQSVKNINPYLTNSSNIFIVPRNTSLSNFPLMITGSGPSDNGNLIMEIDEKEHLVSKYPNAEKFFKKYIGAQELIKGTYRYCVHITKEIIDEAYRLKELAERFEKVKSFRLSSKKEGTKKKARIPHFFDEDRYQKGDFILVPKVGSERREYLPIGYFDDSYLPSNTTKVIYDVQPWLFGVLTSKMHIIWVKAVAGRLKTDMQYSNTLCYNTFPFPPINIKQKETINQYVFAILDERAKYPEKTMAWLYNPETMPAGLKQAHKELDEAIERIYRLAPFNSDAERLEYLFKLYEEMTKKDTLFAKEKKTRKKK